MAVQAHRVTQVTFFLLIYLPCSIIILRDPKSRLSALLLPYESVISSQY